MQFEKGWFQGVIWYRQVTLACAGRTLLEVEIKGLVAALLHEAEHAQQAALRAAALCSLQASPSCSRSPLQSVLWQVDGAMLRYPCASCRYWEFHTIRNALSVAERVGLANAGRSADAVQPVAPSAPTCDAQPGQGC